MHVQAETTIARPRTEVFAHIARAEAEGTFEWTEFDPPSRLAWHGPPAKAGPGSMEPSGWWELYEQGTGTRVKLVMTPRPGGLFRLLAPLMSGAMRKGNTEALAKLKQQVEGTTVAP